METAAIKIIEWISADLDLPQSGVANTAQMLGDGDTVPFISRYRKERTGNLNEINIRDIADKLQYYIELQERKATVLKSIEEQKKLTPELKKLIDSAREKQKLEDLYLPYKPKRQTKATIAKEKGLEPFALEILNQTLPAVPPLVSVKTKVAAGEKYLNKEKCIETYDDALAGAIDIIAEYLSDNAVIRGQVRAFIAVNGNIRSKVTKEFENQKSKFEMYYDYSEPLKAVPSHRMLAIRRGSKEKITTWKILVEDQDVLDLIASKVVKPAKSLFHDELLLAIKTAYERHLYPSLSVEIFIAKMEEADTEAIKVFAKNADNLLLAPPAGHKVIIGVDPGFRTGCKVVVIDKNGKFKEFHAIFPHEPQRRVSEAEDVIVDLVKEYEPELIAIGNGTASKETNIFINAVIKKNNLKVKAVIVSEAGASVYSASPLASAEFSDLDVTVRGAISIARRLQDPLAELVKIDPKSIGVGQYQHDVNQLNLKKSLDATVESAVNYVGANLNSASAELLSYVSGIGRVVAKNIVLKRNKDGSYKSKSELLKVAGLGPKIYEQCAGFLRVPESENPLDNSAIHPERYALVQQIAADLGANVAGLIANAALINKIDLNKYVSGTVGLPTLTDIAAELKKPGVDPRKNFETAQFDDAINDIADLKENMVLNGTVTNVTNFGAFVDIGVHQDGLVHISKLADKFVRDPHEVVAVGDSVKVRVLKIETELKRISLEKL
jgi:uncharacterized protein